MEHSKTPLPEEMNHIEGDENIDNDIDEGQDNQGSQEVDLDNPMLHVIDNDDFDDDAGFNNSQVGSDATQGLTLVHHQNIDESRIDELLVEFLSLFDFEVLEIDKLLVLMRLYFLVYDCFFKVEDFEVLKSKKFLLV